MKRNIACIIALILNIAGNQLHGADNDHDEPQDQQKPDLLADYFGLPTNYGEGRSTPFLIHYMQEKMCQQPACGVLMQFNNIQNNQCALPECDGPNGSVDPLYKSVAKSGSTPPSYNTALSIRYRLQSDESMKEEVTFNGCSHLFHEACLDPGDACAFCGTTMPLTHHTEKKE